MDSHDTSSMPISWPLLIVDLIGTLLVGLGVYELLGRTPVVPEAMRFEHYPIVLMVIGGVMVIPYMASVIAHARRAKQGDGEEVDTDVVSRNR